MFSFLSRELRQAIETLYGLSGVDASWQQPKDVLHGDLTTTAALRLGKTLGKNPADIAAELADAISHSPSVERAAVAGPGYVNVWLHPTVLLEALSDVRHAVDPQPARTEEAPVIVDLAGPNIAKPLGVHHLGSHIIGQVIVNLYRHSGTHVIGWSYPGDWGTQFGKLAVAFERFGDGLDVQHASIDDLLRLYVRFHEEAQAHPELDDEARAAFAKLEAGDRELHAFWQEAVRVSREAIGKLYERLQIRLDKETGESFYQDKMQPIIEEGREKGVIVEGEKGSLIVRFPDDEELPPLLLQKSDGSTLYATRDLAMVRYRIDTCHPSAMYYVVDVAQSLHFKQLFAACKLFGWDLPVLEHSLFGRMRFRDASMSTRKGTVLKLEDVLDEAVRRASTIIEERGDSIQTDDPADLAEMMGIGAVAYGILSQNRKMDIVFDWDRMLSFEGNSAPYIQYTHARARSVLRKADVQGSLPLPADVPSFASQDRILLNTLLQFSSALREAREERLPHKLTNYLFDLCQRYNAFYNAEPILQAEEPSRSFRLFLTSLTADVLRSGAQILTIRVPDRM